jgi:hypothetical protein
VVQFYFSGSSPPNPDTAKTLTLFCRMLGEFSSLPETEFKSISLGLAVRAASLLL